MDMILYQMHILLVITYKNSLKNHFKNAKKFVIMIINANHLSITLIMKEVRIKIIGQREAVLHNRVQIVHKCVMLMEVLAIVMIYT